MEILKKLLIKEVIAPVIILIVTFILCIVVKKFLNRLFNLKINGNKINEKKSKTVQMLITNIIIYILVIIAALAILEVYGIDTKSFIASLGIIGIVVGLALQDTLKDFLAGFNIIVENQFDVGDNIKIGDFRGEVISLGLKTTKIKAYTGEVLIVSNRNITQVINYSLNNSLAIVDLSVSYDSDIAKVEKVLTKLCEKIKNEVTSVVGEVKIVGVNNLGSSSVDFRITAEVATLKNYEVERIIKKEAKMMLDKNGIEIPYNQLVIHNG